jgi:LytR cell envelope-related transcriptional attenuator
MLHPPDATPPNPAVRRNPRTIALNTAIVVLSLVVAYLAYALIARNIISPPVVTERPGAPAGQTIQIDVLNGCGIENAAQSVTSFLRSRGYDVVEMRNYKTFDIQESLVVDRIGNKTAAEQVAYALGIRKDNIVQQLNQDYYVDVSVVVGKDFATLKVSQ